MSKKMKQVTDNIHGTIYLSDLEAELTSTPYFYRLHDVYQSSTVYMTFPSNRTKRYEHSLGTMEIASSMFFSAISNADNKTKVKFFDRLRYHFSQIFDLAIFQTNAMNVKYFADCQASINSAFDGVVIDSGVEDVIKSVMGEALKEEIANGYFQDSALDYFQFYPVSEYISGIGNDSLNYFLYRCILQAIRIVALFHDVGHPPYSHIIEEMLGELYRDVQNTKSGKKWNKTKVKRFEDILQPYATHNSTNAYKCQTLYSASSSADSHLHERIGLSLLQFALNDVIPAIVQKIDRLSLESEKKRIRILYYIIVTEYTMAILVEKDNFFKSLHNIVDGVLDADRFDYIQRDSLNSGVDWGSIPYKRIVNASKMIWLEKSPDGELLEETDRPFVIAYPSKLSDDISDILLTRYKIFSRINFHHRCMKTTVSLQASVRELAENYLSTQNGAKELAPDINILWTALSMRAGDKTMRIIQWNDSWLITVLHHALVELNSSKNSGKSVLKENLEEILLHKKRYYSLIKRGADSKHFVEELFKYIGLTEQFLSEMNRDEWYKYYLNEKDGKMSSNNMFESDGYNALEAIKRTRMLLELLHTGDMELLENMMPSADENAPTLCDLMENALNEAKKKKVINDYKVIVNISRKKDGLPKQTNIFQYIYLYAGDEWITLNVDAQIRPQIEALEKTSPWIFVYYVPAGEVEDTSGIEKELLQTMVSKVGDSMRERFKDLFSHHLV